MHKSEKVPYERDEQKALVQWMAQRKMWFFHPENEDPMSGDKPGRAVERRRMGVFPGVPDLIIITPPPLEPEFRGVAIELKRRNGTKSKVTKAQWLWLDKFSEFKWVSRVCYGAKEAQELLLSLGY